MLKERGVKVMKTQIARLGMEIIQPSLEDQIAVHSTSVTTAGHVSRKLCEEAEKIILKIFFTVPFDCPGTSHFNMADGVCDNDLARAACPLPN